MTLHFESLSFAVYYWFLLVGAGYHHDGSIEKPLAAHSEQGVHEDASPSDVTGKVKFVLVQSTAVGLAFPKFLLVLSWGSWLHLQCPRSWNTSLMNSDEPLLILRHWWKPSHSSASNESRTWAARNVVGELAQAWLCEVPDSELDEVSAML